MMIKIQITSPKIKDKSVWLSLPAADDEKLAAFNSLCEGLPAGKTVPLTISGVETDMPDLKSCIHEFDSSEEVNLLSYMIENMTEDMRSLFSGILREKNVSSLTEALNEAVLVKNGDYEVWNGVTELRDVGTEYLRREHLNLPEILFANLNYEGIGMDLLEGEGGGFVDGRYVRNLNTGMQGYDKSKFAGVLSSERMEYENRQAQETEHGMTMGGMSM